MSAELFNLLDEIEIEKGINKEVVVEALELALLSAYKKNFGAYGGAKNAKVTIDKETGEIRVVARKTVVSDDDMEDYETQIYLDEAQEINPNYQIGDIVEFEVTPAAFGRIAAQTARQMVLQKIREAERERVYDQYSDRANDIMSAVVRRIEKKNVILEIGDAESVLMPSEQVKSEEYEPEMRMKVYVTEVTNTSRGVNMVVSRSHPGLVRKLFELEVPEIQQGIIEIKAITREPGSRTKIAVSSTSPNVDPIGTCIGPKGMRVQAVIEELRGEKIDIVKYSENPVEFVTQALSPAEVVSVELDAENKSCKVKVPANQLSLAIGKEGQNVRLAARLTNYKIDIKPCE